MATETAKEPKGTAVESQVVEKDIVVSNVFCSSNFCKWQSPAPKTSNEMGEAIDAVDAVKGKQADACSQGLFQFS